MIRANRTPFGERNGRYYFVSLDGGFETPLPIVNGGFAALSPNDNRVCFTPVDREFRTWKRYKGGRASDLWIYDLENNSSEQITTFVGSDQWPIWMGNNIIFASDRDLRLNLYRYNTADKTTEQLTQFKDFDVMWPSGKNGKIVYENGGYLYVYTTATNENKKLEVALNFDNPNLKAYFKNVEEDINSYSISPSGKRVLFDARGDIFSVPAENGNIINLTKTQAFVSCILLGHLTESIFLTILMPRANTKFTCSKTKKEPAHASSPPAQQPGNMKQNGHPTANTLFTRIAVCNFGC